MQGAPMHIFQGFSAPPLHFGSTPRFPGRARPFGPPRGAQMQGGPIPYGTPMQGFYAVRPRRGPPMPGAQGPPMPGAQGQDLPGPPTPRQWRGGPPG